MQTLPRTLLIQIRFRCRDAALSANVVNALIRAYGEQDSEARVQATAQASTWLESQLKELKARVDQDQQRLAAFQREHGLLTTPETLANGQQGETEHTSAVLEIDELGRQLVAASTDRILREAQYRAAQQGDPELVIASDPRLQAESGNFATALLQQIHARRSELEQEQAQLSIEHGPNFPRVVEIRRQLQDLDRQKKAEDAKLVERFRSAWQTAADREQLVRKNLEELTAEGMKANEAATQYAAMREEANASHELYVRVLEKVEEAGLAAGIQGSNISVVDSARQPVQAGGARSAALHGHYTLCRPLAGDGRRAPDGVDSSLQSLVRRWRCWRCFWPARRLMPRRPRPAPPACPRAWSGFPPRRIRGICPIPRKRRRSGTARRRRPALPPMAGTQSASPMPAPIAPGDFLDVSEVHTPEFHSAVRVSASGTVTLPMVHEVQVGGLDEQAAAHAIEAALMAQGMLLHPQVSVLVTSYAGQDVSVLGEVVRPGVYPYTLHHRLLDLISAASGLAPNAGRLVNVFHRDDAKTPHPVVLDPSGTDTAADHNPELAPGDTVQVSRAGLVYVVGDVHASRRISRRSGAGADRGAGAFAGLGTDAERRHGQGHR